MNEEVSAQIAEIKATLSEILTLLTQALINPVNYSGNQPPPDPTPPDP